MIRTAARLAGVFSLVLLAARPAPAVPDDDPVVDGKKASEWVSTVEGDPSARKRALGVAALAKVPRYEGSLPAIARAFRDSSTAVRFQAASVTGGFEAATAAMLEKELVEALKGEKDGRVRKELVTTVGRFPAIARAAVGPLTDTLKDSDPATRAAAADALGRAGAAAKFSATALVQLLGDADRTIRASAVFALGRVAPEHPADAAAALVRVLAIEKEADVRREAVVALRLLGDTSEPTVKALVGVLKDPDAETRRAAIRTLGRFGLAASAAASGLLDVAATDKDKDIRLDAVRSFGSVLGPAVKVRAGELIRVLEKEADFEVRIAMIEELAALGNEAKDDAPIMSALRRRLSDPQPKVREAAAAAIKRIEMPPPKKP